MEDSLGRRRRRSGSAERPNMSIQACRVADLNLVLCGSDAALKASVSKSFRGEKTLSMSYQSESISECVMEEEMIHGRLISLVELPALSRLSEEEVMRETLNCVFLCDPGVHVFLLIIPVALLTDEDKAEIEKVQKRFDSREHFMLLFTTEISVDSMADLVKSSEEYKSLISFCEGRYRVMGLNEPENSRQIPELLEHIENMKTEPYSLQMYMKAQENRARREAEEKYEEELKRIENKIEDFKLGGAEGEADYLKCLRIVLIGRTGNGKSATGNTILGRNEFHSQISLDSVTTACQKRVGEVDGRSVAVVDTPGLFDTTLSNDQVVEEIMKCISLSSPGPHVFVIVLSVERFTREEMDTVDLIKKIFGPKAAQFSIVLFTRGDQLDDLNIEDFIERCKNAELKKLIRDCGNRFLVFNNREKQDKTQVIHLLNMIEELKNTNKGRYFTNSMFEEAEMAIKKKMEEILKEKEREIAAQNEALKVKYENEKENLTKRLKEETQRADEERMKMENQIRKERRQKDLERQQQRRLREITEKMMQDLQREKTECDILKHNHEEEMKRIQMKYEDEARRKAEELNEFRDRKKHWMWHLKDMLDEQDAQHDLLREWCEDPQEEGKLIKRKRSKRKRCVIL